MAKQNLSIICCWALALGLALTIASATTEQQQGSGCQSQVSTTSAQEQMISLSKLVDPSGKLSKIISEFQADARTIDHPKRSAEETPESQGNGSSSSSGATPPSPASNASASSVTEPTPSVSSSTTTTTTTTTTAPSPTSPITAAAAVAATSPATTSTTPAPIPAVTKTTESSNVTVNVFLQLVPDAKTDELINNPDSTSSPQPEQPATSAAPPSSTAAAAAAAAAVTTQATLSSTPPTSSAKVAAESATTAAPVATSASTDAAPSASPSPVSTSSPSAQNHSTPASRRRRRRSVVSSEAPAVLASTSTSTSTTTSTTTTAAPSSTTTTTTLAPSISPAASTMKASTTTSAPSSPSSTASPPATTATAAATSTQTAAASATSPSSAEPVVAKSSPVATTSVVEVFLSSTGTGNNAQALDSGMFRMIDVPFTIEVVSSSASNATTQTGAAEQPSTPTPTPTTTTAPTTPTTTPTTTTTASTTTTTAAAPPKVTEAATSTTAQPSTTSAPSSSTSTTSTTTTTTSLPSSNSTEGIGMLQIEATKKETAKVRQPTNLSSTFNNDREEDEAVKLRQFNRVHQLNTKQQQKNSAAIVSNINSAINIYNPKDTAQATNMEPTISAIDNLNVIYDNDTSIAESPPPSTSIVMPANTGKARSPSPMGDFVNCDRPEEAERENYATCKLEPVAQATNSSTKIEGLMGRINFWQPINGRGILHMLVRVRYQLLQGNNQQTSEQQSPMRKLRKRESFRAPIELAPTNGSEPLLGNRIRRKHTILVADRCNGGDPGGDGSLIVGEPSATTLDAQGNSVDMDAELLVPSFNLNGQFNLVKQYLVLNHPNGTPIGCCQVITTEQLVSSELDNMPSVQVVQPIREELLPSRLKATGMSTS